MLSAGFLWCAGCAHAGSTAGTTADGAATRGGQRGARGPRDTPTAMARETPAGGASDSRAPPLPARPLGHSAAREMIEDAFTASAAHDTLRALQLFGAVLSSDTLTDRGRANLYWVVARLHRDQGNAEGEAEALAAFLVASEFVPPDERIVSQQLVARALRAALRVENEPHFGRTPDTPIRVEDTREPASILASLPCGQSGEGRYLDIAIDAFAPLEGERLIRRRAACDESGDVLDLWFDVTYARHTERP